MYPDVDFGAVVFLSLKEFGSSIRWTAAVCAEQTAGLVQVAEAEIYSSTHPPCKTVNVHSRKTGSPILNTIHYKSKVLPSQATWSIGRPWSLIPWPPTRTQPNLQDHDHGATVSHGTPVYSSTFAAVPTYNVWWPRQMWVNNLSTLDSAAARIEPAIDHQSQVQRPNHCNHATNIFTASRHLQPLTTLGQETGWAYSAAATEWRRVMMMKIWKRRATCNLDVERRVKKKVFRLEVTVHDASAVAVSHGGQHLTKPLPCLALVHSTVSNEVIWRRRQIAQTTISLAHFQTNF